MTIHSPATRGDENWTMTLPELKQAIANVIVYGLKEMFILLKFDDKFFDSLKSKKLCT